MKATHYRAYAKKETVSRRDTTEGKQNVAHDVHDVVAEGRVEDGTVKLSDAADYVVFYNGTGDKQTSVGRVDGPFKKGDSVAYVAEDHIDDRLVASDQVLVDGETYRKV